MSGVEDYVKDIEHVESKHRIPSWPFQPDLQGKPSIVVSARKVSIFDVARTLVSAASRIVSRLLPLTLHLRRDDSRRGRLRVCATIRHRISDRRTKLGDLPRFSVLR
jgi:hypothetical protein